MLTEDEARQLVLKFAFANEHRWNHQSVPVEDIDAKHAPSRHDPKGFYVIVLVNEGEARRRVADLKKQLAGLGPAAVPTIADSYEHLAAFAIEKATGEITFLSEISRPLKIFNCYRFLLTQEHKRQPTSGFDRRIDIIDRMSDRFKKEIFSKQGLTDAEMKKEAASLDVEMKTLKDIAKAVLRVEDDLQHVAEPEYRARLVEDGIIRLTNR